MLKNDKRLTILSQAERSALYLLPDFNSSQRLEYLTLSPEEYILTQNCTNLHAKIYCILQIGYFKAKQFFFRFKLKDIAKKDIAFIIQHYFPNQPFTYDNINKHEHYNQCNIIATL